MNKPCCAQTIERAAKVADGCPLYSPQADVQTGIAAASRDIAHAIRSLPIEPVSEDDVERVALALLLEQRRIVECDWTINITAEHADMLARAAIAAMGGKDAE